MSRRRIRETLAEIAARAAAWTWQRPPELKGPSDAELLAILNAERTAQVKEMEERDARLSETAVYWCWDIAGETGERVREADALHDAEAAARRAYLAGRFDPQHQAGVLFVMTERGLSLHSQLRYSPRVLVHLDP